jgi:hypothetical protein
MHYWTGRGTLCSLDNSVSQKPTHTNDRCAVTCRYCAYLLSLSDARQLVIEQDHVARSVAVSS